MKDIISYYYNIDVMKISYHNNKYYIDTIDGKYIIKETLDNIDINLINKLKKYKYFSEVIKNIYNEYTTTINKKRYIMLKIKNYENYKICLNDIKTKYYLGDAKPINNNWVVLWENKIDAFEKMLEAKKEQYLKLMPICHYYIGIGENAILYLKKTFSQNENYSNYVASHKRISIETTLSEYYDPTNIIIDYPYRDIAEYTKSKIINGVFDIEELNKYLLDKKFSNDEIKILLARIMFPTFFFDYIEKEKKINAEVLEKYIEKYELALCDINKLFKNKVGIVDWLQKK